MRTPRHSRGRLPLSLAAALVTTTLLAPAPADAQRRRRAEADDRKADLGRKKDAGLDESLKADIARKAPKKEEARPALQFDQFRRTVEVQVAEKRREQIHTLSKIVELGPSREEAPGLLFHLSELYWEEAKYFFYQANAKDDEIIAAEGNPGKIEALKAEKQALLDKSEEYRRQSIQRYRDIVKEYPDFERLDEVLYSLGANYWERGEDENALKAYKILIQKFPDSGYIPDAYLAIGEYYFNQNKIRIALKAYQRAASYTDSKVYGFAMYKMGWCYYNIGNWAKSADQFKAVVFYGDIAAGVSGENKIALVREARRDYVLAYSHVGSPKTAKEDFQVVGGDTWPKMLKGLAGLYYDEGKDREAIVVYRVLIKEAPISPDSPGYQARIVDAAQRLGNKRYTVKQARLLVRLFQEVEKSGVIKSDDEKEKFQDAQEFAERTLRTLAVTWHSEAKKTRDDPTFVYAKEMYGDYVALFPTTKYAYDMHFYYGELLYHLEDYATAAEQYTKALLIDIERAEGKRTNEKGEPEKPGKFLVDAAFNAILSYEDVARRFEETEQREATDPGQPMEIPGPKQALLDACERYLKYVPGGERVVEVTYKAANIFYRYNRFDDAVARFSRISLDHPDHELAEYSANLVLDSYNLLGKPAEVNAWARRFYANKRLAKGKFASDLAQVIEDSALTMVEEVAKSGDYEKAAVAFEGFVKEFPNSAKSDKALFNASVAWANSKKLDRALELRARIISEYPRSELVPEAVFTTAVGYESVADFTQAAKFYEAYVEGYVAQTAPPPKATRRRGRGRRAPAVKPTTKGKYEESKAQQALFNAAVLREGLGHFQKSRANRLRYVEMWPNASDAEALFLSVAELFEDQKQYTAAAGHLGEYLKRYKQNDADAQLLTRLRMVELYEKAGRRQDVDKTYGEIRSYWGRLGKRQSSVESGLLAVASAQLLEIEPQLSEYRRLKIEYPWQEGVPPKKLFDIISLAETPEKITSMRQVRQIKAAGARLKRGVEVSDKAFRKSLEGKSNALKAVVQRYMDIVKYKQGEPALCALEKIGSAYLSFVEALKKAPPPPYLQNEEQEMMYRDQLMQQALPLEEQAVEAYAAAVAKSRELTIYDACAKRSLAALKELRPSAWPDVVEQRVEGADIPQRQLGNFLLAEIQPIPEPPETTGELPADVADGPTLQDPEPADEEPRVDQDSGRSAPESRENSADLLERDLLEPDDEDLLP